MKYVLISINVLLIGLILLFRSISHNWVKSDFKFLGIPFMEIRMRMTVNYRIFFYVFILIALVSLFLKVKLYWKAIIVALSILGYFLYYNAYQQIMPW